MQLPFLVLFLSQLLSSVFAVCPPEEFVAPCRCSDEDRSIRCVNPDPEWNLTETFLQMSPYVPQGTLFSELYIYNSWLTEIPAHAIADFTFQTIVLVVNNHLTYISPEAFSGSYYTTLRFEVDRCPVGNEVFQVVNNFLNLFQLKFSETAQMNVPNRALTSDNLERVEIHLAELLEIEEFAFAGLRNLRTLAIRGVNIEAINANSFSGLQGGVAIDLSYSPLLTPLEETKFKPVLDSLIFGSLQVGGMATGPGCAPFDPFCHYITSRCDESIHWVCANVPKYQTRLRGYACNSSGSPDIWDYCATLNY